jgi:long-chain acyl-CoA synthetase
MCVVGADLEGLISHLDRQAVSLWASLSGNGHGSFEPLEAYYAEAGELVAEGGGDDPCLILPTAAVEGVPRGALLSHHNLLTACQQMWTALGLGPWDRHLAALPLFHITGLGLSLAVMYAGGVNVLLERFDPQAGDQLMDAQGITLMATFPPILASLLDARAASGAQWKSLRYVLGLDSPEAIQRLMKETRAQFWTGYGQSETSGVVTLGAVTERPGSAGRPLPAAWVRCVDKADQPVGVDQAGEIVVRGPLVFQGYWGDPSATEYAFRGGWHHTGDLGKFDQQGYLYYLGRKPEKDLIKSGGENIYPAEVERVLRSLPGVREACVIGVPDERWGEAVKAVVELEEGVQMTPDALIAAVAERIASYKKPRHVVFVERLPQAEGEVDREAVKAEYGEG